MVATLCCRSAVTPVGRGVVRVLATLRRCVVTPAHHHQNQHNVTHHQRQSASSRATHTSRVRPNPDQSIHR